MRVNIHTIKVSQERLRQDNGDLEGLAQSLLSFGQLQPVILSDEMELLAGFRRYSAAMMNGWQEIDALVQGEITAIKAREIELEENIRRKQMTWQEEAKALTEIDKLRRMTDPNWTQSQTAALASVQRARVPEANKLVQMMEMFPEIGEAKNFSKALKMANQKAKQILRVQEVKGNVVDYGDIESKLVLGDSTEVIKTLPDNFCHAVITDPPFGINHDERTAGMSTGSDTNSYEDSEETYERLLAMAPEIYRVLKPDGWCIWFLGISWYERAKIAFRSAGFTVDEIPVIWDRTSGRTFTARPDRWFTRGYDVALHMLKGNPQLAQRGKSNILSITPVATSERELLVERPVELYAELIQRLTVRGETVVDFFTGSGSCLAAAAMTGREFFGVELSAERRAYAIQKIKAHTPQGS